MSSVFDRLDAVLGQAAEIDMHTLSLDDLAVWVCRLQSVRARVDALVCQATVEADVAGVAAANGLFSVSSFVAGATRSDGKAIAGDRRLGHWLARHPVIAEAFGRGALTRRHIAELAAATNGRTAVSMVESQEMFVEVAATCDFKQFVQALGYWTLAADPDGREPEAQVAARSLSISTDGAGVVTGRFVLDPVAGQIVKNALDLQSERLRRHDDETAFQRTAGQRRADALVGLLVRGAAAGGQLPLGALLHVVMAERVAADTLQRLDGEAAAELPDRLPLDARDPNGRCELADGTPLHPRFGVALLAIATLRRLVLGADGEVLDLGRGVRGFPAHLRQALLAAARGRCQHHPACDAPTAWLQADHLLPWARDGLTAMVNGQMVCRPHNQQKSDRAPED